MDPVTAAFHNIRDHIEVLPGILQGTMVRGGARERLLAHILREEVANRAIIAAAIEKAEGPVRLALELAHDHSLLVCDIIRGEEIGPQAGLELLHHFLEEHDEGLLAPPAPPDEGPRFTVGSLLRRGTP